MTARSKLLELINSGRLPSNFSFFNDNHSVTAIDESLKEWRANTDCGDAIPFAISNKGPISISQKPQNAAYSVGFGSEPTKGSGETRVNVSRRPITSLPVSLNNDLDLVLHLDTAISPQQIGTSGSLASITDLSRFNQVFVNYKVPPKSTMGKSKPVQRDAGSTIRPPNMLFSGRDSYLYADSADNWNSANNDDSPEPDHLVSITGSTIYLSFVATAGNQESYGIPLRGSGDGIDSNSGSFGPQVDSLVATGGGFSANLPLHYCITNATGSDGSTKIYLAELKGDGTLSYADHTSNEEGGVAGTQGEIILIENLTASQDFDIHLSEILIYDKIHADSEISGTLRYLYCKNHIFGTPTHISSSFNNSV